jgi:hypothetical protein
LLNLHVRGHFCYTREKNILFPEPGKNYVFFLKVTVSASKLETPSFIQAQDYWKATNTIKGYF